MPKSIRNYEKRYLERQTLGHLSHQPSKPVYYILDWQIFGYIYIFWLLKTNWVVYEIAASPVLNNGFTITCMDFFNICQMAEKSQPQTVLQANSHCVLVAKAPNRSHSSAFICQRYHLGSQHGTMFGIS